MTPHVMSVPALVMNCFEPFTTHAPSTASAVVRVAPASDPASGSVRPKAASFLPEARSGSQRSCCSWTAEEEDRHRAERGVRRDRDRDRRVDPRQLFDGDRICDGVRAGPAVLLGDRDSQQAEVGHFAHELVREAGVAVELLGQRRYALPRERSHRVAEQLVLGREVEVHGGMVVPLVGRPTGRPTKRTA